VLTLQRKHAGDKSASDTPIGGGGIAVAVAPPQVQFTASGELEVYARKRNRIAIRHVGGDRVVAVLEIVSPGNKASRHALRAFIDKAVEFLEAGIHLLVLDLFPPSSRDPEGIHAAIWSEVIDDKFQLPAGKRLTLVSYSAGSVKRAYIEPVSLGAELPQMPLFLEPDFYVNVPLEATYQTAFQAVPKRWRSELEATSSG
jgi:hypothetical protein